MDARTSFAPSSAPMISRTVPAVVGAFLRLPVLMTLMLIKNLLTYSNHLLSDPPARSPHHLCATPDDPQESGRRTNAASCPSARSSAATSESTALLPAHRPWGDSSAGCRRRSIAPLLPRRPWAPGRFRPRLWRHIRPLRQAPPRG